MHCASRRVAEDSHIGVDDGRSLFRVVGGGKVDAGSSEWSPQCRSRLEQWRPDLCGVTSMTAAETNTAVQY